MKLTFEPVTLWWLAVAAAAPALAAAAFGAWRARLVVGARRAAALFLLRAAAITAALWFVLGPVATFKTTRAARGAVAVVVDSSASMDLDAGGETRLARALGAARLVAREVERGGGTVYFYDFAALRRPWGRLVPDEKALKEGGDRSRSDAAAALAEVANLNEGSRFAAAVVVSDGGWGAAPEGRGLPPCYTMAVGEKPPEGLVFIEDVETPALALPGTPADVRVRYFSTLKKAGPVAVTVSEFGGGEASYRFVAGGGAGEARFAVAPAQPGDHFYRLRVSPGVGETWVHVKVLGRPFKVWYWEMAGDADFAFLRRALAAEAGFNVAYRLDVGGKTLGNAPTLPADADVVIIGNPRAAQMGGADAAALERYVAAGGGLLIVASARPVDAAALSSGPLAALSPVRITGKVGETAGGELVAGSYPGGAAVAAAPPAVTNVWRLGVFKEGAAPVWAARDGTPALVIMPYGSGRVGLLAAGGLFRWQLTRGGDALTRLAAALMFALHDENAEPLTLSAALVAPGDVVEVTCRAATEPTVVYAGPDGVSRTAALAPAGAGFWSAVVKTTAAGPYDFTARLPGEGGLRIEKGAVLAVAPTGEYRFWRARPERLSALAAATGGAYFADDGGKALAAAVGARLRAAPRVPTTRRRALWPAWLAFPVAVLLLAGEWVSRRRIGLK